MNERSFMLLPVSAFRWNGAYALGRFLTFCHFGGFMRSSNLFRIVLACLLFTGMVYAQGVGASGDIRGTVSDPTGAVVSKATVTATDTAKGIKHTAITDPDGEYRFGSLPPATYDISIQFSGFQTAIQKGVSVNIGQTLSLDFHMTLSKA